MALKKRIRKIYGSARQKKHVAKLRSIRASIEEARKQDKVSATSKSSIAVIAKNVRPRVVDIKAGSSTRREGTEAPGQINASAESLENSEGPREIDEDEIRENKYVCFVSAGPEAWTAGPARIIAASDGLKKCAALLLTSDLTAKVRRAVEAQRKLARLDEERYNRAEVISRFQGAITVEMARHEALFARLQDAEPREYGQEASLLEEHRILERMRDAGDSELKRDRMNLESRGSDVRAVQGCVMACLEEAFIYANLMEPEEEHPRTKLEDRDLGQEYEAFRRNLEDVDDDEPVAPLDTNSDYWRPQTPPPMTEEQRARQNVIDTFWQARERLEEAQRAFDNKDYWIEHDRQAEYRAFERGEESKYADEEAFDLHWLKRGQEMTRELMEAEEAFSVAQAHAREAGINVEPGSPGGLSSRSCFVREAPRAEERVSGLHGQEIAASRPMVRYWLGDVLDPLSPSFRGEAPEADEWDGGEVGICDSISAVAEGDDRKRIDRWRVSMGLD